MYLRCELQAVRECWQSSWSLRPNHYLVVKPQISGNPCDIQEVTKTNSSVPALQSLPSHQEAPEAQVKATKKPGRWFTIGKFKQETKERHKKPAA